MAPLAGVRVIELANFLSGPFSTMMLADLGAEVVKIEPERGDPFRRFNRNGAAISPLFANSNRGKRGVTLNLKSDEGQRVALELIDGADVVVSNWRPGVADRLGLGDTSLVRRNPTLIRAYITGFGQDGPRAILPTYDGIIQAHLGGAEGASDDHPPTISSSFVVDKGAATMVAQAVLAALFARERHGRGDRIDLSLLDAAAYAAYPETMANRTLLDGVARPARNTHAATTRAIRAADGWLIVVPVTGKQIERAFEVVGAPEVTGELLAMKDATALTARIFDELEIRTRKGTVEQWVRDFAEADVPAGPCLTIDEHLDDDQVRHNGLYCVSEWPGLPPIRAVRYPAVFASTGPLIADGPPPQLGPSPVLADLGPGT